MGKQIMEKKKQTVPKPKLHKLLSYPSVSSHYAIQNFHCIDGIGMTLVVCALACGAAVLGVLVFRHYCHQKRAGKSHHTFCVESFQFHWGQVPMQGMWCMMRLFFLQPPPPPPPPLLSFQLNQMQPMPLLPEWPVIITPHSGWYCPHIHGSYLLNHQLVFLTGAVIIFLVCL